jgi:ELWxxDGT repeat protein
MANETIFFLADYYTFDFKGVRTGTYGELWVTDGTAAGTSATNLSDNPSVLFYGSPISLVSYQSELLLGATSGLYLSDGTAAGTSVLDISGANANVGLQPVQLTVFNGEVYFSGLDANGLTGLWVTNGAGAGTSELAVAGTDEYSLLPYDLTVVNTASGARLVFGGAGDDSKDGLWISDGTAAGTSEIAVPGAYAGYTGLSPVDIAQLGATTFIFGGQDANGDEQLFVSDGTSAGTSELTNIPGVPTGAAENTFFYGSYGGMAALNGHALFSGYDAASGTVNLWITDGTAAGTSELVVANADALQGLRPVYLTTFGNKVLFDGLDANGDNGLWISDGTAAGTSELVGIANPGILYPIIPLTVIGTQAYFSVYDSSGNDELWVTDGTVAGTSEITSIHGANVLFDFTQVVSCFVTGTRIRTPRGEVAIEDLAVGDTVLTHDGETLPIIRISRREVACEAHPAPASVRPVRVTAGAFGRGLPARDLVLSPDHAVFADGVLIPIRYLINDRTVVQERATRITYWHVELPRHAVLLAEGLPAESYLETGQRDAIVPMHADFAARVREAQACAPIMVTGPVVAALRARLSEGRPEAPPLDSAGDKSPDPILLNVKKRNYTLSLRAQRSNPVFSAARETCKPVARWRQ